MTLRHYTDDVGRVGIEASGAIFPGIDGRVYLTPDEYESAGDAREKLALPRLPSGYFEVPDDRLFDLSPPRKVESKHGQPGGGREQYVTHPVDASGLTWYEVSA